MFTSNSIRWRLGAVVAAGLVVVGGCATDNELAEPRPTVPVVTTALVEALPTDAQADNQEQPHEPKQSDEPTPPDSPAPASNAEQTENSAEALPPEGNLLNASIALEQVLILDEPIDMAAAPGDPMAWIAERGGRVLRVDESSQHQIQPSPTQSRTTIPSPLPQAPQATPRRALGRFSCLVCATLGASHLTGATVTSGSLMSGRTFTRR